MLSRRRALAGIFVLISAVWVYRHCCAHRDTDSAQFEWFGDLQRQKSGLNDTLGFENIFVINLPSRRDRRNSMAIAGELSQLSFEFVDGFTGGNYETQLVLKQHDRGKPPERKGADGAQGSWASHISVVERVVNEGLGSALVLEDDIDWDVRLKMQMSVFAAAARLWQSGTSVRQDKESLSHKKAGGRHDVQLLSPHLQPTNLDKIYGENWDVLWLGHCGADLPPSSNPIITVPSDMTVPQRKHLKPHPFALHDKLANEYPAHTRVIHAVERNVCSLAYAVSARGARKLAKGFREEGYRQQWDLMLRDICMGKDEREGTRRGEEELDLVCLTVQPPLFSHRFGGDTGSDIRGQGGGFARGKKGSPYIRISVHENLVRLKNGLRLGELVDLLPDDGEALW
ncbi:glycosyltransferase family 25 protein [Xylariaceae sp. FL1272]|nr:glycosyltransferase family 25 protein [Xylariaceae sp. FL1272]